MRWSVCGGAFAIGGIAEDAFLLCGLKAYYSLETGDRRQEVRHFECAVATTDGCLLEHAALQQLLQQQIN
jgi:hypothetical protein